MRRNIRWLMLIVGCLCCVHFCAAEEAVTPAAAATQVLRYVRCSFQIKNVTDRLVPLAELWVAGPLEEAAGQKLVRVDTSYPCDVERDELGNRLLHFTFTNVPPYAVKIVNLDCHVLVGPTPPSAPPSAISSRPDELMPFEDPEFKARKPTFPNAAPMEMGRAIFSWVREHLEPVAYDPDDRGALYALMSGKGDCTEYAALFAALCRAQGVPARVMGGYRVPANAVLDPRSYHNWAEFWAGDRWVLADPHAGTFDTNVHEYISFRVLGESNTPLGKYPRFRVVGSGMKGEML